MAAKKIEKTNAARLIDRAKIPYTLIPYEVDEEDLSCTHVAAQLGEAIECVFKTLVLKGDRSGYFVCVGSGNKKADLIPMKELLPVTGYIRGGCSPIGMKRAFPTYIHSSCLGLSEIYVSAGVRGLQIRIAPDALIAFTRAETADLIRKEE